MVLVYYEVIAVALEGSDVVPGPPHLIRIR